MRGDGRPAFDPKALEAAIGGLLRRDSSIVVLNSAVFPILRQSGLSPKHGISVILEAVLNAVGPDRTLFVPTFTSGFVDGVINLDAEDGNTGVLGNALRKIPGAKRTASAFFSFAAFGPLAETAAALRPENAWGDGSVYSGSSTFEVDSERYGQA